MCKKPPIKGTNACSIHSKSGSSEKSKKDAPASKNEVPPKVLKRITKHTPGLALFKNETFTRVEPPKVRSPPLREWPKLPSTRPYGKITHLRGTKGSYVYLEGMDQKIITSATIVVPVNPKKEVGGTRGPEPDLFVVVLKSSYVKISLATIPPKTPFIDYGPTGGKTIMETDFTGGSCHSTSGWGNKTFERLQREMGIYMEGWQEFDTYVDEHSSGYDDQEMDFNNLLVDLGEYMIAKLKLKDVYGFASDIADMHRYDEDDPEDSDDE
jgi:hypothetical protein